MPRIAVAIFVVVAVSVSIGINIARYPAVFQAVGTTHESLVSNDTTDVSEAKETEGPVAVSTMPALPDNNLAKWNPPMVTGVQTTVAKAVPHVASNPEYASDVYTQDNYLDPSSENAMMAEESSKRHETSKQELNDYEVEPYQPYTSQPPVAEEERIEEAIAEPPQGDEATKTNSYDYDWSETESNLGGGDEYQPNHQNETRYQEPSSDRSAWENYAETSAQPNVTENFAASSANHLDGDPHTPGVWPATVAQVFQYKSEPGSKLDSASLSDEDPGYSQDSLAMAQNVSSTARSVSTSSIPDSNTLSESNSLHDQDSSTDIFEERGQWHATVPLLASRERQPMDVDTPRLLIKRLPAVEGADLLPGALPPAQEMNYPVTQ